jgi:hypothetical protein
MPEVPKIEKLSPSELADLRHQLVKNKVDSWQAADAITAFLAGRGYGVNAKAMRKAAPRLNILSGAPEAIQKVLENVAYVM